MRRENYVLAVIKTTETYDNLRDNLADLQMEMSNLKEISANNCTYKTEYFLGGDLKFLALVCGLGRANEDYVCVQVSQGATVGHKQNMVN